jgi:hypothetical protein
MWKFRIYPWNRPSKKWKILSCDVMAEVKLMHGTMCNQWEFVNLKCKIAFSVARTIRSKRLVPVLGRIRSAKKDPTGSGNTTLITAAKTFLFSDAVTKLFFKAASLSGNQCCRAGDVFTNYGSGSATLDFAIEIVLYWVIWTKKFLKHASIHVRKYRYRYSSQRRGNFLTRYI